MKNKNLLLIAALFTSLLLFSYQVTHALFSDTAVSSNNTFTASSDFGQPEGGAAPPTATVVISEVQINSGGTGGASHDFVEFYNPTNDPFDLNGHRLVKRIEGSNTDNTLKSWTSSAIIPAHGFYLWASSDDGYAALINADASTLDNITIDNSVALRSGQENIGSIIDALSWDSSGTSLKEGTEYSPDPGAGQSLERKAYSTSTSLTMGPSGSDENKGNSYDSDNNINDFVLRVAPQPQNSSSGTESP